jgi:hypothetical protein
MTKEHPVPRRNLPPRLKALRSRRLITGSALLAAGAAGGGILASSVTASATAGATAAASTLATTAASGSSDTDRPGGPLAGAPRDAGGLHGLNLSGTITAIGSSSLTIKTSTGTSTYSVGTSSDIDKNGEASLSSLAVGDKVTFNTVQSTSTIAHLHAGNEALDAPHMGPGGPGGDQPSQPGRPGQPGQPGPGGSTAA